jgi:hypothetical protein
MNVDRRLEKMRELLERSRPCKIIATFADGTTTITDPTGAWSILRDHPVAGNIVSFEADRPEYKAAANIMTVLCHPVPDRRISDYE